MISRLGLALVLAANLSMLAVLQAEPAANPSGSAPTTAALTPPMPMMKPPVTVFRELLAMTPTERERNLAERPQRVREAIIDKLKEYEAMKPEERELRLRKTELRWYLLSFIKAPAPGRATELATVPEADRKLVTESLNQWDHLAPDQQQAIVKYEATMEEFLNQRLLNPTVTNHVVSAPPMPARVADPFKGVVSFMKLAPEQRQKLYASFQSFFDLSDAEKQKTLDVLSTPQRIQLASALTLFGGLPKSQREQFLNSFDKLSSMSETERQDFLKNAERWQGLPPAEKQAWRTLITHLPPMPPMPPEIITPPPFPRQPQQANATANTN